MNSEKIDKTTIGSTINVIRIDDLAMALGCTRTTIWRMCKRGELPKRKRYSRKCVGWDEATIREWMATRPYSDEVKETK